MLGIGLWASNKNKNLDDYMLGGRRVRPSVAALSAGASDMSGWLLMGLPGAIYLWGLTEAWIAIGLTMGTWLNWKLIAPRLRTYTEVAKNSITIPSFFENRFRDRTRLLRVTAGIIILVFFTFYVSSGMVAGGKFFQESFDSTYLFGMFLVAGITVIYTMFGGFLGAAVTDVVQGLLMLTALIAVPIVTIISMGGWGALVESLREADAAAGVSHTSLFANITAIGLASSLAWGLGYFGQPHIIVRFMALRSVKDTDFGRRVGITWMVGIITGSVMTAVVGAAYFQANPQLKLADPETVFLVLSEILFHPFVAGMVLAAVLAAIMSTVSSQLIVTSSALVEDLYRMTNIKATPRQLVWFGRGGVILVAIIAAVLALNPESSVLELVAFAWAGFGASFGPVIVLSLFWAHYSNIGALVSMVSGAVIVGFWSFLPDRALWGLAGLYELLPGFIVAIVLGMNASKIWPNKGSDAESIAAEFAEARKLVREN